MTRESGSECQRTKHNAKTIYEGTKGSGGTNEQRCGLESHDLDSSQTRVMNLMTLDST